MLGMFGSLLWRKKKTLGQTVAEYALIVSLVAVASIAILTLFGDQLRELYNTMTKRIRGEDVQQRNVSGSSDSEVQKGLDNL